MVRGVVLLSDAVLVVVVSAAAVAVAFAGAVIGRADPSFLGVGRVSHFRRLFGGKMFLVAESFSVWGLFPVRKKFDAKEGEAILGRISLDLVEEGLGKRLSC